MRTRNLHALNAILRRSERFPVHGHAPDGPQADDYECPWCGSYLDSDGLCEDCDA